MGVASLILGIISLITSWIPFVCFMAFILAVVGLILGIVDAVKKGKTNNSKKGFGIAGLVISAIAIPIIIFTSIITFGVVTTLMVNEDYNDYDYYKNYDYDDWYENWYNNYYNKNRL